MRRGDRAQRSMTAVAVVALLAGTGGHARADPFRITAIDAETRRGVPLVELTTVHAVPYVTDSAGVIAFDEPGLLGQEVFFFVRAHGYRVATDGFGIAGARLSTTPGGAATIELERVNVAERLYRTTGAGIYRDSVRLGDAPPSRAPLLNGGVLGQDSVQVALYRGRLHWFWGDTARASYPLGNFAGSGATSALPRDGGRDPAVGIDLAYFVGADGFTRAMCPMPGKPGPVWFDAVTVVPDADGTPTMVCRFMRVKALGVLYEQGLARWSDRLEQFEPVASFPIDAPIAPHGHALLIDASSPSAPPAEGAHGGAYEDSQRERYVYFANPHPTIRVPARLEAVLDLARYEAYTCLTPGSRYRESDPPLERDAEGAIVWGWKRGTAPVTPGEEATLARLGHLRPQERRLALRADADAGKDAGEREALITAHAGSVHWNAWRKRFVMIAQEAFGTSAFGEIWYAEAHRPEGPWEHARKIVTHDDYTYYNPLHHPFFDQEGGRVIYFEGTYSHMFSGTKTPTPRYDYNQIVYRLDLSSPRLGLPSLRPEGR